MESRPLLCAVLAVCLAATCATDPDAANRAKYPRRPPGCKLAIFFDSKPQVGEWDDLGTAEAICHIDVSWPECFQRLRTEACRMGGDIIYHVPKKPLRPREQANVFRGRVAHTRAPAPSPTEAKKKEDDAELPPPATPEESAGPVVPLTNPAPAAPAVPRDAGSDTL